MPLYMPYVVEKETGGHEKVKDLFTRLLEDRIVFIGDEFTEHMANVVIAQLLFLSANDSSRDICIYINSPGGSVSAGLAVHDTIRYIKPEVSTICIGQASSMGAFILAAGAKGKRFSLPNSRIMIHQVSGGARGTGTDVVIQLKELVRYKELLTKYLAEYTGQTYEKVFEDCERDKFMSAAEALEYGLIDNVLTKQE